MLVKSDPNFVTEHFDIFVIMRQYASYIRPAKPIITLFHY